jgi:hypothetical protein
VKHKHLYSLLDQSYTTIHVVFATGSKMKHEPGASPIRRPFEEQTEGESGYVYKAPLTENVKVDDYVVVHTPQHGLAIAKVVKVDEVPDIDLDAPFDYKWIVQRIDRESYNERLEREKRFAASMLEVERQEQREKLVTSFKDSLPEGSAARALFDQTVASLAAPTSATAGVDLTGEGPANG